MANIITFLDDAVTSGDEISTYVKHNNTDFDLAVTVIGTQNSRPSQGSACSPTLVDGNIVDLTFDAVVNGGNPIISYYHNGASTDQINQAVVNGSNSIVMTMLGTRDNVTIYFDGRNTFDINVTNFIAELRAATTTVEVEWIDSLSAAATGNKIYRDTVPPTGEVEIADIANGVQIYQDDTAETGTEYKYKVQAYSATDETTQEVLGVNVQFITTA